MVYRRREWMVALSHLWTMVSRNMFLRLNLIFHLASDGNNIFFISLIWLFYIYKIQKLWWNSMFYHYFASTCTELPKNVILFFYPWLSNLPPFFPFLVSDGMNINSSKSVKVQYFDWIFSGASWVNTETRLFDKNRNFIFSGLSFGPTLPSDILFNCSNFRLCNNFRFLRIFDLNKYSE